MYFQFEQKDQLDTKGIRQGYGFIHSFIHAKDACLTISVVVVVVFVTPGSVDDVCMIVLSIIAACGLADRFVKLSFAFLRFISIC